MGVAEPKPCKVEGRLVEKRKVGSNIVLKNRALPGVVFRSVVLWGRGDYLLSGSRADSGMLEQETRNDERPPLAARNPRSGHRKPANPPADRARR